MRARTCFYTWMAACALWPVAMWAEPVTSVRQDGGDLYINGQPFSAFMWTWRDFQYVFKKENGRFANINVANLLRPVSEGGFGFNCVFGDDEARLKPRDFAYLAKVGGHVCVQTCVWAGLNPWGPKDWNVGFSPDPVVLSDGTRTKYGSFDSQKNRDNFVRDLKLFKGLYGSPPALLGFYMFESTPDMPWDNSSLYSDYSPASKERFRKWLASRYGSIGQFNAKRHAQLASFEAAEPPASPEDVAARGLDSGYWNDWIDFRYWDMADFLAWARGEIKSLFGKDKMLIVIEGLTSSYASNDPNVTGANSEYAIDERQRAHSADAIGVEGTYDYMPNHVRIMRRATDFNRDGLPDIPIIMDYYNYSWQPKRMYGEPAEIPRLRFVDELGEGATGGLLEHSGQWLVRWEENSPDANEPMLDGFRQIGEVNDVRCRYQNLFAHARIPHDVSIVLPVWQLRYDSRYRKEARFGDETVAAFQHALQRSHRQIRILYADEPLPSTPETFFVPTGFRISHDFISRLAAAVKNGAHAYIEGVPTMDEEGHAIPFPLADLVGANVAPESATEFTSPEGAVLPCKDAWKLENVEGEVLARFPDGSPAVARHRYFQGEVTYCPSLVGCGAAQQAWKGAMFEVNFPESCRAYYGDICAHSAEAIASVSGARSPSDIRLHLLVPGPVALLLVTNWSSEPQDFTATVRFHAGEALDLRSGKPVHTSGDAASTNLPLHLGGHDWAAIAVATGNANLEQIKAH